MELEGTYNEFLICLDSLWKGESGELGKWFFKFFVDFLELEVWVQGARELKSQQTGRFGF